jgi:hypothetical protein
LAEGFTLHIAPTTTNYEKLFNLTKAHLGLISQLCFEFHLEWRKKLVGGGGIISQSSLESLLHILLETAKNKFRNLRLELRKTNIASWKNDIRIQKRKPRSKCCRKFS